MQACHEITELLSASLDGQLSEYEQAMLNEHLKQCPACSALFDELQSLHQAAAQLEDIPAPEGFAKQVMDRIAADPAQDKAGSVIPFPAKKSIYRSWKKWAVSAAALAIVILGAATLPGQLGAGGSASPEFNPATADSVSKQSSLQGESEANNPTDDDPLVLGDTTSENVSPSQSDYCGTLVLSGDVLPEDLDQYAFTTDKDGSLVYTVPADYFFSLKEKGFFSYGESADLTIGSPDAPNGRIIVKPAP